MPTPIQLSTIAVANLATTERYADHFEVECWTNPTGSLLIGPLESPAVPSGGVFVQAQVMFFTGLTLGTTYYFRARVIPKAGGPPSSWSSFVSETAGDVVAPTTTYSPTSFLTAAGVVVMAQPATATMPSDHDHFEFYHSLTSSASPAATGRPTIPYSIDAVFSLVVPDTSTLYLWVRDVDTSGNTQNWSSLGAFNSLGQQLVISPTASPRPYGLSATGQAGEFVFSWNVVSGYPNTDTLSFELQTSPVSSFASGLTTYGPLSLNTFSLYRPNVTVYWRARSKYPGIAASPWVYYGDSLASIGPRNPSSTSGTISWVNPNNVFSSDNAYATFALGPGGGTEYMMASLFGFVPPSSSEIRGVFFEMERKAVGAGELTDNDVALLVGGLLSGTQPATAVWPAADAYIGYGSSGNTWNLHLTPEQVSGVGFGFAMKATETGLTSPVTAQIDHIRGTIYHTLPASVFSGLVRDIDIDPEDEIYKGGKDSYRVTRLGESTKLNLQASVNPISTNSFFSYTASGDSSRPAGCWVRITWDAKKVFRPDGSFLITPASSSLVNPPTPSSTTVVSGSLSARTRWFRTAYVKEKVFFGFSVETSASIPSGSLLRILPPPSASGYDGWIPMCSDVSGNLQVLQPNFGPSSPIAFGSNWTEPTGGITLGGNRTVLSDDSSKGAHIWDLPAVTTRYLYPSYDDPPQLIEFSGGPFTSGDTDGRTEASSRSARDRHYPLWTQVFTVSTPALDTGGGGGGGGSGVCVRRGTLVRSRKLGVIMAENVEIGDEISNGSGWTTVVKKEIIPTDRFVRLTVHTGDSVQVVPNHTIETAEGETRVDRLTISSLLVGEGSYLIIKSIELVEEEDDKVLLYCEPDHRYLAGEKKPAIVVHNINLPC